MTEMRKKGRPAPRVCRAFWGEVVFLGAGVRGGWQKFQEEEAEETEMEGSSQALCGHGRSWCGGSLQYGAELCGEADGPAAWIPSQAGTPFP